MTTKDRVPPFPSGEAHAVSSYVRVRLDIAYDGAGFAGWAFQPGQRTVAGELRTALGRLFADPRQLTVAGRTDAGVHATGQVAHVDVLPEEWDRHAGSLLWRLRGILPEDVKVTAAAVVPGEFNARFSALSRRYEYRISDAVWGVSPLRRHDVVAWPRSLDAGAMNEAAAVLLGEHDFAAFCRRREGATTIRQLQRVQWRRDPDGLLEATVVADAFCHSMVRSIVGAMAAVGEGRRDTKWLKGLLRQDLRSGEVTVAPAHGLTLVEVMYPDDPAQWSSRQELTRRIRILEAEPNQT